MMLHSVVVRFFVLATAVLASWAAWADDPPARVARLSLIDGSVSFAPAESNDWVDARLNRPITTGDRLWVDRRSRAELRVGSTALRAASQTSLDVLNLDDRDLQLKVAQGILSLRVRSLPRGESLEIDTPNLAFVVREPGEYRFDVADDGDSTTVTVRDGAGTAYGRNNSRYELRDDQQAQFYGDNLNVDFSEDAPRRDAFDRWVASRDERDDKLRSRRYVSPEMTGYEDLDDYGTWREVPSYGTVWVPRVTVGWAPYHYGHWAWISPWGWTWVDDAPWGFAPFHYGRWAHVGGDWCWIPGPVIARPVYAPALVAFVGGSSRGGVSWGISLSTGVSGVAWFPLGPGEVYRPAYRTSTTYVTEINRTVYVRGIQPRDNGDYFNRRVPGAIAAVPRDAFVNGRPVDAQRVRLTPEREREIRQAPVDMRIPLAPNRASLVGAAKPVEIKPTGDVVKRDFVAIKRPPEAPALRDPQIKRIEERPGMPKPQFGRALLPAAGAESPVREGRPEVLRPGAQDPRQDGRDNARDGGREEGRDQGRAFRGQDENRRAGSNPQRIAPQPDVSQSVVVSPNRQPISQPIIRSEGRGDNRDENRVQQMTRPDRPVPEERLQRSSEPAIVAPKDERRRFQEQPQAPERPQAQERVTPQERRPEPVPDNSSFRQSPAHEMRPAVREARPAIREERPQIRQEMPQIREVRPPQVQEVRPPQVQEVRPPQIQAPRPTIREMPQPVVRERAPEVQREQPQAQHAPEGGGGRPQQGGPDELRKRKPWEQQDGK